MARPRVLVLTGYGINCDFETKAAFETAGARADRVHINDLISGEKRLSDYQILAFPGGFSFGDDIASGRVFGVKVKINLGDEVREFIDAGKLVLGVCNGFQAMAKYGLLSGPDGDYRDQRVTVTFNDTNRYEDRWVYLKSRTDRCVWTRSIDSLYIPVAHGEGKFYAKEDELSAIEDNDQVVFSYSTPELEPAGGEFPWNPNGSLKDIAAMCDKTGRLLGIMPHPERFLHFTNHPRWTRMKEELKRKGREIPEEGDGVAVFRNGVEYFN
ncbi:MAG: phosphoribosylformylglycinamidine synthase I [bacterium]